MHKDHIVVTLHASQFVVASTFFAFTCLLIVTLPLCPYLCSRAAVRSCRSSMKTGATTTIAFTGSPVLGPAPGSARAIMSLTTPAARVELTKVKGPPLTNDTCGSRCSSMHSLSCSESNLSSISSSESECLVVDEESLRLARNAAQGIARARTAPSSSNLVLDSRISAGGGALQYEVEERQVQLKRKANRMQRRQISREAGLSGECRTEWC